MRPLEFGNRDEVAWGDELAVMEPTDERFEADCPARPEVDDRLEVETEVSGRDALGEVRLELKLRHRGGLHGWVEHLEATFATTLRHVHRDVGVSNEIVGCSIVGTSDRDADACAPTDAAAADLERFGERGEDSPGDAARGLGIRAGRKGDHELVPTEPRRGVAIADRFG